MKPSKASTTQSGTTSLTAPDTNTSPIISTFLRKWSSGICMPRFGAPKKQSAYTRSEEDLVAMQLPKVHTDNRPSFDVMNPSNCQAVCQSPLDKRYKTKNRLKRRGTSALGGIDEVAHSRVLFSSVSMGRVDLGGLKTSLAGPAKFESVKMVSKE